MEKLVTTNRSARRDYSIEATYEAGIVLTGTEVKSLRRGSCNMNDGFALVRDGEVYLYNVYIAPYEEGNRNNHEPTRTRKLLLNRNEIARLTGKTQERGFTLIPLKIYFKHGYAKVEIAVAKGMAKHDKRDKIKKREQMREIDRAMKDYRNR